VLEGVLTRLVVAMLVTIEPSPLLLLLTLQSTPLHFLILICQASTDSEVQRRILLGKWLYVQVTPHHALYRIVSYRVVLLCSHLCRANERVLILRVLLTCRVS
jgi:hypothetical protein